MAEGTNATMLSLKERLEEETKFTSSLKADIEHLKEEFVERNRWVMHANTELLQQLEKMKELLRNEKVQLESFKLQMEKKAISLKGRELQLQNACLEIDTLKQENAKLSPRNRALETASSVERSTRDLLEKKVEGLKSDVKQLRAQFYSSSLDSDPDSDLETCEDSQKRKVWRIWRGLATRGRIL